MACVARLEPSAKGQDILFEILSESFWKTLPIQVNLYGSGNWEVGLRELAAYHQLECVRFHGHVSRIVDIWNDNHLLVLPSRYEGTPLALIEAMWCGRPCVVTKVGGNSEICVDGETGFVAAAAEATVFGGTLKRAWDRRNEWEEIGTAARKRIEQLIPEDPVESFCAKLLSIFRKPDLLLEVL